MWSSMGTGDTALVTGASTGIGRATVRELGRRGYTVYATARRREDRQALGEEAAAQGWDVRPLSLDVADPASVETMAQRLRSDAATLDVLVNNAGYALVGAVTDIPRDRIRHLFDVNVFGVVDVTRACLPFLRAAGGRVINVSSLAGKYSVPFLGSYCASKFALEALSDAMRLELRPLGLRVVLVEPGPVATPFQDRTIAASSAILENALSPFARQYAAMKEEWLGPRAGYASAEAVARTIAKAARARRPRRRYAVRWREAAALVLRRLVPDALLDRALARIYVGDVSGSADEARS
jgi:NAD(P)-dependent dehydrogenase (short-subunit alcohol dehydrogenase family)